jgi:dTMP kinase
VSDRRNHFVNVIKPALDKGKLVIGNRYYPVNVAFSAPDWREKFLKINQMVVDKPDLVIIIDVPAQVAIERMNKRGDPDIFDRLEIMERNREGYQWYMKNSGDDCIWVDGNRSREEIHQEIIEILEDKKII